jgi:hypothetical protein
MAIQSLYGSSCGSRNVLKQLNANTAKVKSAQDNPQATHTIENRENHKKAPRFFTTSFCLLVKSGER